MENQQISNRNVISQNTPLSYQSPDRHGLAQTDLYVSKQSIGSQRLVANNHCNDFSFVKHEFSSANTNKPDGITPSIKFSSRSNTFPPNHNNITGHNEPMENTYLITTLTSDNHSHSNS